jgi:hypothetical protein
MVGGYLQAAGTWSLDDERPAVEADRSEGGEMYLRFDRWAHPPVIQWKRGPGRICVISITYG